MYRWKDNFSRDDLDLAETLLANVRTVSEKENTVSLSIMEDDITKVRVSFKNNSIGSCECSSCSDSFCYHIAVLLYYIERHANDFNYIPFDENLKNALNRVDENSLRDFLFNEMMINEELKDRFCDDYKNGNLVDKSYYRDKLDAILESGMGDDYDLRENPDINLIANSLYDFIYEDISNLMVLGEDVFAAELLNRCAYVLYDEINVGSNHWYDCASIFDENAVIILINNEENSNEVFDELESNSWKISEYGL